MRDAKVDRPAANPRKKRGEGMQDKPPLCLAAADEHHRLRPRIKRPATPKPCRAQRHTFRTGLHRARDMNPHDLHQKLLTRQQNRRDVLPKG
jgi:hypothetical protein